MIAAAVVPAIWREGGPGVVPVVVQAQFDAHGAHEQAVQAWLDANFRHLLPRVTSTPGIVVQLTMPDELASPAGDTWADVLIAMSTLRDVAYEIIAECFTALRLAPCGLVSSHLTQR